MYKETVIEHFKTGVNTAKALGIARASVSQWGEKIPEKQA